MNKEQKKKGEKIASNILRVLAIIGFVAIIALATWLFVQAIDGAPTLRDNLRAAVTTMRGVVDTDTEESLTFNNIMSTLGTDEATTISWKYAGEDTPATYNFSYACGTDVEISMFLESGWTDVACADPVVLENPNVTIMPSNKVSRLEGVTFTVEAGYLSDTMLFSVVNTNISMTDDSTEPESVNDTTETNDALSENADDTTTQETPVTSAPATQRVVERRVPIYNGPADLVVEIEETGVLLSVAGEDTFFPVSPIPADKVAGVVFTVTNKGGVTSKPWKFEAELPIEGDDTYSYTSPLQIPLASGMQITFTLGFDELLESDEGEIRIELDPRDNDDKRSNNTDSVKIDIKD